MNHVKSYLTYTITYDDEPKDDEADNDNQDLLEGRGIAIKKRDDELVLTYYYFG